MSDRCKNCGYCPHCGRSDKVYPRPYYPWGQPYWYNNPNITIQPCTTSTRSGTTWTLNKPV